MPTTWIQNQKAQLFQCDLLPHTERPNCPKFEDYYPGEQFVDVVGVSFYNRWKANSNRLRLTPQEILYEKRRNTFERLKKLWKPVMIDEVWTSSIWYEGGYSSTKTRNAFLKADFSKKEEWLSQLKTFLQEHQEILGVSYFNIDYTNGYQYNSFGEGDWAIIDLNHWRFFNGFFSLCFSGESDMTKLMSLFTVKQEFSKITEQEKNKEKSEYKEENIECDECFSDQEDILTPKEDNGWEGIELDGKKCFPPRELEDTILVIDQMVSKKYPQTKEKNNFYQIIKNISFGEEMFDKSIQYLADFYED